MVSLNPCIGNNFLDSNALDHTDEIEDAAMDEILKLHDKPDTFTLLLPYSVKAEIEHPSTPAEKKRKAAGFLYSMEVQLTQPELATHEKIRALIQGNAQPGRHAKDAFHLVESAKYGGRHFITKDGRLLKKAPEIWVLLRLRVLKPSEFLAAYHAHPKRRLL
jgi:predicted nucleic acid-binding protein